MPRLVDYYCDKCKKVERDVYYHNPDDVQDEIKCKCGAMAEKVVGTPHYKGEFDPINASGQEYMEHFESGKIVGGKYVSRRGAYQRDQARQDIPMNLKEV